MGGADGHERRPVPRAGDVISLLAEVDVSDVAGPKGKLEATAEVPGDEAAGRADDADGVGAD